MKKIEGYKAFNKDLKCKGYQYKEGEVHETDKIDICREGFHFCENPLDCWAYYDLMESVFHKVTSLGKTGKHKEDSKVVTTKLQIGVKVSLSEMVKASVDFILKKTFRKKGKSSGYSAQIGSSGDSAKIGSSGYYAKIGSSGNYAQIGSSGDSAQIGSSGDSAQIGSSGDYAQIGSSGDYAQIGSSGDSAKIGSSGYYAKIGSSGDYAKIGSSGYYAQIGSSGYYAKIGSSGYYAKIGSSGDSAKIGSSGDSAQIGSSGDYAKVDSSGKNSVIMCAGHASKAKGKKGSWITLSEWKMTNNEYTPICVKTRKIDGKHIKADTWYKLIDKKFVEIKDK